MNWWNNSIPWAKNSPVPDELNTKIKALTSFICPNFVWCVAPIDKFYFFQQKRLKLFKIHWL